MMMNEEELKRIRASVREMSDINEVNHYLRSLGFRFLGLTRGLPVAQGKDSELIFHDVLLRGQGMQVWLNLRERTFMILPLEKELLYTRP